MGDKRWADALYKLLRSTSGWWRKPDRGFPETCMIQTDPNIFFYWNLLNIQNKRFILLILFLKFKIYLFYRYLKDRYLIPKLIYPKINFGKSSEVTARQNGKYSVRPCKLASVRFRDNCSYHGIRWQNADDFITPTPFICNSASILSIQRSAWTSRSLCLQSTI